MKNLLLIGFVLVTAALLGLFFWCRSEYYSLVDLNSEIAYTSGEIKSLSMRRADIIDVIYAYCLENKDGLDPDLLSDIEDMTSSEEAVSSSLSQIISSLDAEKVDANLYSSLVDAGGTIPVLEDRLSELSSRRETLQGEYSGKVSLFPGNFIRKFYEMPLGK